MAVFIVFLTSLAGGLLGVLALCSMSRVERRFVHRVGLFALCLLLPVLARFGIWAEWRRGGWAVYAAGLTGLAIVAAFAVLALSQKARRHSSAVRGFAGLGGLLAVPAAWAWGFDYGLWHGAGWGQVSELVGQATMALLLGSASLAAVLGHMFLTRGGTSLHPLRWQIHLFVAAVVVRGVWTLLACGGGVFWRLPRGQTLEVLGGQWLALAVRGGLGLLVPGVLAYMTLQAARARATESAAGLLDLALVLTLVGELVALHLVQQTGLPF